jgi:molecular chaperone DnaK (HSP70)
MAKLVVGIDLGTTNSAVAWAEAKEGAKVHLLPLSQLVAEGELGARPTLPSLLYLAGEHDLPPAATRLPWDDRRRHVVGVLARAQGARVPQRMVASAKSWLCHAGVDRHADILPWGTSGDVSLTRLSPVSAQALLLSHMAEAWQHDMGAALAAQDIVLTVPASFDEVARELTLEAATRAGLPHVTLLEEPQAVFYAWMDAHTPKERRALLTPGDQVLVCDVGGGTTDFTLIRAVEKDGIAAFERVAVGDHLLLGGDNIDIALAQQIEARLGKLDTVQWHGLVHACRLAKEQLFEDPSLVSRTITVAARGSKLIGGTLKAELHRHEVEELVLGGFFPIVEAGVDQGEPPRAKPRVALTEFGLPYATEPAITRHLADFLQRHQAPRIAAVVFNGGAMKPAPVRERVLAQLERWQGARPSELANVAPELAVAYGAATYGLARQGFGERILGGAARAYYVGVGHGAAVCVLPRGAEEGTEHELAQDFALLVNRPASFHLYSSTTRDDAPGALLGVDEPALSELPPLRTVLRMPGAREAHVHIRALLTEVGTMELYGVPLLAEASPSRFRLSFDLRARASVTDELSPAHPRLPEALALLRTAFCAARPASLMADLETTLEERRDEWSTALIRALWDAVYAALSARAHNADVEARWLNLSGFLLRPGTGAPLDEWRAKEIWKLWNTGLCHDKDEACRLAWWILWRRISGGLKRGQQEQIYDRVAPLFLPGTQQKSKWFKAKPSAQEVAEMWRVVASLERLLPAAKTKLGEALLDRMERGCELEVGFWALGRLGARLPLYGPADTVVPPATAERWIERVLALPWDLRVAFAAAQLGRKTGDRARDISDGVRTTLAARLHTLPGGERTARLVEEVVELEAPEEKVAFGDSLPSGLRRLSPESAGAPSRHPSDAG